MDEKLQLVESDREYDSITLLDPADSGYILVAAEVDQRQPFLPSSSAKQALIRDCKILCQAFERTKEVRNARVFRAFLVPPGRGKFLRLRPRVHVAKFDVVILVEAASIAAAQALREGKAFSGLERRVQDTAAYVNVTFADNIKRIGPVDYDHGGVFLFNFFYADNAEQNVAVWEYTAAWFQEETGLDNSVLMRPLNAKESDYTVINHCRWDHLSDILPSVILKPTFRSHVLKNFEANNTAAMPILYRLA